MENTEPTKVVKKKPEEIKETNIQKPPIARLNKQAILYVLVGLSFAVLIGMSLKPSPRKQEEEGKAPRAVTAALDFNKELDSAQAGKARATPQGKEKIEPDSVETVQTTTYSTMAPPTAPPVAKRLDATKGGGPSKSPAPAPRQEVVLSEVQETEAAARKSGIKASGAGVQKEKEPSGINRTGLFRVGAETSGASFLGTSGSEEPSRAQQYKEWNDQPGKIRFAGTPAEEAKIATFPAQKESAVMAGTIMPAVLVTGINTDLPGDIMAVITENIYDTVTGENLLIPQGSKILARYNSNVTFGQKRVQIVWDRLIRPDGVSVDLGNMTGVDPQGYAGTRGRVNEHFGQMAKGIGLMMAVSIVVGQIEYTAAEKMTPAGQEIAAQMGEGIQQTGQSLIDRAMDIQPTITVSAGTKVQVFINTDLYLPAAESNGTPAKYTLKKAS